MVDKKQKEIILKQFQNNEDKIDFSKIYDKVFVCIKNRIAIFSDFINPIKAETFCNIFNKYFHDEIKVVFFGGYEDCERGMIGLFPLEHLEYLEHLENIDEGNQDKILEQFPIDCIKISHNSKFVKTPSHRDYLGSIIGLGITRDVIGDILIKEDYAVLFCENSISSYIEINLEKVGRACVKLKIVSGDELQEIIPQKEVKEYRIIVASLRIDVVISACFKLSRSKAKEYIDKERAFINWKVVKSTSKVVEMDDIITIRGKGRIKVKEIVGNTKKDRIVLLVEM